MPQMTSIPAFFGDEWERFLKGFRGLDPRIINEGGPLPGAPRTITVPGWDSIIKTGPRPVTTSEDWGKYFKAERTGQPSGLDPAITAEINRKRALRDANQSSAQPAWAKSYGQVMTAIDNVQDFASTVATLGRLALWGAPPLIDKLLPGASPAVAATAGRAAGNAAAIAAEAELRTLGLFSREFIDAAAGAAARAATKQALLGAGARLALRAVPIVGWVVLASDLLNLMNLFGMVAMPLYALLCNGPREALLAGIPAAILKSALCKEVWTQARLNPLSRTARASRALRSMGKLPGVGNLIEVAQTADNLFGYGLGLGSLYGMAMEGIFSLASDSPRSTTTLNFQVAYVSLGGHYVQKAQAMSPGEVYVHRQAAGVMITNTALAGKQDLVDEETHLLHATVMLAAVSTMAEFFRGGPHQELMRELLPRLWGAPEHLHPNVVGSLDGLAPSEAGAGHWWIPGTPSMAPGDVLIETLGRDVTRAVGEFIKPRRNLATGAYYGAVVNQVTDYLWTCFADDDRFLKWELEPDYKLLTGMMVDGRLIPMNTPEPAAWRFWQSARALLEERGGELLYPRDLDQLAAAAGIPLLHLLSPDAAWPPEWAAWLAASGIAL
jgi:hypothetical protein